MKPSPADLLGQDAVNGGIAGEGFGGDFMVKIEVEILDILEVKYEAESSKVEKDRMKHSMEEEIKKQMQEADKNKAEMFKMKEDAKDREKLMAKVKKGAEISKVEKDKMSQELQIKEEEIKKLEQEVDQKKKKL